MNRLIYIFLFASIWLLQCTPKTTDKARSGAADMKDKATEMADKANDFRAAPPAPGPAPKIELGTYESFQLENGLQVIVVENHKIPRVSYQLTLDLPLIAEKDKVGLGYIAGELIGAGTTSMSKSELDEAVDFMGARLSTSSDGIFASSLKKHSKNLLTLMADVLKNPAFSEAELDKIKKRTISGLESEKDDPDAISRNVAQVLRYGKDHPYGEVTTEQTISNITVPDCKNYYQTYFQPNMAYLVIVGDVTPAEAKTMTETFFADWKKGAPVPKEQFDAPSMPEEPQVNFVNKSGAVQSVLAVTYPLDMKPGDPDAIKASVMNQMYGGFFGSYLNLNLREDKAYTYGARSRLSTDKHIGYFTAGASVRNEVTDSALVQIFHEMYRIRDEKLTDDNLTLVKNVMSGNFARSLEKPETIARFALNTARYNLPDDYYQTYLEKIEAITKEDIMAMAQKYIQPENAHILVVGNKDEVADKLTAFAPDGEVHFYDNYGNPIKMDDTVVPEGMTAQKVIEDYLNAIGGADKLRSVKDMTMVMGMEMQGMQMTMTNIQKAPNKLMVEMAVAGMGTMSKQVFDGEKGSVTQMGQSKPMTDDEVAEAKSQATMFEETQYTTDAYTLELKGIEQVEGTKAYKILVTDAMGKQKTEFYDMETSLKIREIETSEANGQTMTQTVDYANYQAVNGIMVPHQMTLSGVAPAPMKMEAQEVKINTGVEDAVFKIE